MDKDFTEQNRQQGKKMLDILESLNMRPSRVHEGQYSAICPFHEDHRPSFSLKTTDGVFNCFGCHAKGTYWDFILSLQESGYEGFGAALSREHKQRIRRMVERGARVKEAPVDVVRVRKCHGIILRYWHEVLFSDESYLALVHHSEKHSFARSHFIKGEMPRIEHYNYESPSLSIETIKKFHVGFAPTSGSDVISLLKEQGFTRDEMIATGLIQAHGNNGMICPMAGRVIYPYVSADRKDYVIGRITQFSPNNLSHAKYLKQALHDNRYTYPLRCPEAFNVSAFVSEKNAVLITEGITDAIKSDEIGVPAIALGGIAFGKNAFDTISTHLQGKIAIVCFDTEDTGRGSLAATTVVNSLRSRGVEVWQIILPRNGEKTDVCSFILSCGAEAFHSLIEDQTGIAFRSEPTHTSSRVSNFMSGKGTLSDLLPDEQHRVITQLIFV